MIDYIRFEIYLPRTFTIIESVDGKKFPKRYSLPPKLLTEFVIETRKKYQVRIQNHQQAPTHFRGWWPPNENFNSSYFETVIFDHIIHLLGLVKIDEAEKAIAYFERWKNQFEEATQPDVILIIFYPVQIVGHFFDI